MVAIVLTFLCFAAIVAGAMFVTAPWGRGVLAVGVLGLLVLEVRERAGDG